MYILLLHTILFIGNYNLHLLTWQDNYKLRVNLTDWDLEHRYALYQSFSVGNTNTKYELNVTDYSGTAGKPFTFVVCINVMALGLG
jgi:hypothetical protein